MQWTLQRRPWRGPISLSAVRTASQAHPEKPSDSFVGRRSAFSCPGMLYQAQAPGIFECFMHSAAGEVDHL